MIDSWSIFVPDIVGRFLVGYSQTYEMFVDSICVNLTENQPQDQASQRFQGTKI